MIFTSTPKIMMWVIQHNLLNDDAYWRFTVAFDEMGIPWKSIKVIPFADNLTDFEDTPTLVTSPKNVAVEYRFFVVGGKVITGSQYRVNERLKKRFISFSPVDDWANPLDREVWEFAQARVNDWAPADAFVMDIGVVGDEDSYELKIVEINSFNCSGIYDCDERAIIQAVEALAV